MRLKALKPGPGQSRGVAAGFLLSLLLHPAALIVIGIIGAAVERNEGSLLVLPFMAFIGVTQWLYLGPAAWLLRRRGSTAAAKGVVICGCLVTLASTLCYGGMGLLSLQNAAEVRRIRQEEREPPRDYISARGIVTTVDDAHFEFRRDDGGVVSLLTWQGLNYVFLKKDGGYEERTRDILEPGVRVSVEYSQERGKPPASASIVRVYEETPRWFSAWAASHNVGEIIPALDNTTIRMIVRPTISGQSLRVKLENTRAKTPAVFSGAFVGVSESGASIVAGTNARLTFRGQPHLTLAPGEGVWSDPLPFNVKAFERLAISLDVTSASDVSLHALGLVRNYSAPGSLAAVASGSDFTAIPSTVPGSSVVEFPFYWIAALDVMSSSAAGAIVAFGDSWVDGRCSTTETGVVQPDRYQRWIDVLADRLAARRQDEPWAVVNAGIAGNRIIPGGGNGPAALERAGRDVLERAGATHVLYLQGMNDIGGGAPAAAVTAAIQQIIDRVHAKGLSVIGGTLFPVARPDRIGWSTAMETQRIAVNRWIRTQATFDAVIDFDRLMSGGPAYDGIASLKPEFACDGDLVHPNAAGYKAMAELVDLGLFKAAKRNQ